MPNNRQRFSTIIENRFTDERQITATDYGHILTHRAVWSADSEWLVYDIRSDPSGAVFDGTRIEMVSVKTGEIRILYDTRNRDKVLQSGANESSESIVNCGVASFFALRWGQSSEIPGSYSSVGSRPSTPISKSISSEKGFEQNNDLLESAVIFIHGPENPGAEWSYRADHRRGIIVHTSNPGKPIALDAADFSPPFTPGALRGGSHVHMADRSNQWIRFTYEDHIIREYLRSRGGVEHEQQIQQMRNIGISIPGQKVVPRSNHPRNYAGEYFSILASKTVLQPRPGSDEIRRAQEECWIESSLPRSTSHPRSPKIPFDLCNPESTPRGIAFQGEVISASGQPCWEVFVLDLPTDLTIPGDGPLEGTATELPFPPRGIRQTRITYTSHEDYPGIQGPRHWLQISADGKRIAFLRKDRNGIVQLYSVSPEGSAIEQLTDHPYSISTAFTWHPVLNCLAFGMDNSICVHDCQKRKTYRLTQGDFFPGSIRPEASVFSPAGDQIAYVRCLPKYTSKGIDLQNQIFVCSWHPE